MRMSKELVYQTFRIFCKKASKVCVDEVNQEKRPLVGGWRLEYLPTKRKFGPDGVWLQGYIILEEGDGEIFYPFGEKYRPALEMVDTMSFCISMLEIHRIDDLVQRQRIPLADDELRSGIVDGEQLLKSRR